MSVPPSNRSSRLHLTSVRLNRLQPLVNNRPQESPTCCQPCFPSFITDKATHLNPVLDDAHLGVFEEKYRQQRRPFIQPSLVFANCRDVPQTRELICRDLHPLLITRPATPASGQPSDECGGEPGTSRGINSNHGASR